jgi:signal peptidase I
MQNEATPQGVNKGPGKTTSPAKESFWTRREVQEVVSFLKTILIIVALVILIRGTLIEPFKIPSASMVPTLKITDHILVSKLSYGIRLPFFTYTIYQYSTPKRGDIVVFTRPDEPESTEDESAINLIKRVIGLPGDEVRVHDAKVFINGQPLDEPYARWVHGGTPEGEFGPEKVPEGRIFLLGDNRDESKDSRFWKDHFLEIGRVKGRALIIYWTWDPDFFSRLGKILK